MNQRITENIDYLRFKDQLRNSELRSSRASVRSNHSQRSHHSRQSASKRVLTSQPVQQQVYEPINRSRVDGQGRDKGGLHYYRPQGTSSSSNLHGQSNPTQLVTRSALEHNPSQTSQTFKPSQSILRSQVNPVHDLTTSEAAKDFARKPVTIDTTATLPRVVTSHNNLPTLPLSCNLPHPSAT